MRNEKEKENKNQVEGKIISVKGRGCDLDWTGFLDDKFSDVNANEPTFYFSPFRSSGAAREGVHDQDADHVRPVVQETGPAGQGADSTAVWATGAVRVVAGRR